MLNLTDNNKNNLININIIESSVFDNGLGDENKCPRKSVDDI